MINKSKETDIVNISNILSPMQLMILKKIITSKGINFFKDIVFHKDNAFSSSVDFSPENSTRLIESEAKPETVPCPRCKSTNIVKNGKNRTRKQCYRCNDCRKNFCDSTDTLLSYSKKTEEEWLQYVECMFHNMTIRESAKKVGITTSTAFQWRHKILNILKNSLSNNINGIIEMAEIKITENFKGNHSQDNSFYMNRQPRKRGLRPDEELVEDKINVLCCKDRLGGILTEIIGKTRLTTTSLYNLLCDKISEGSIICTNNNAAFSGLAHKLKLIHYKGFRENAATKEIFNTLDIRTFKRNLLIFMRRFNGVATKYFNSYIAWFHWLDSLAGRGIMP